MKIYVGRRTLFETDKQTEKAPKLGFIYRLNAAFRVLFPEFSSRAEADTPATIAKNRLRMILYADRLANFNEINRDLIKNCVVEALEEYVIINKEEDIDASVTMDDDIGIVFLLSVPIRKVVPKSFTLKNFERTLLNSKFELTLYFDQLVGAVR